MPSKMTYQLLILLIGRSHIFLRLRVTIDSTRISRQERPSSAGCFRRRALIRARRQKTKRAKHRNCDQLDSIFSQIVNFHRVC